MGKIKLCVYTLVIAALLLTSCGADLDRAEYRYRAFECTVSFEVSGETVVARVSAHGGEVTQTELHSPAALSGIRLLCEDGRSYAELDGMRIDTDAFAELTAYCRLVLPEGDIKLVSRTEYGGRDALFLTAGGVGEGEKYEIYIDKETYTPLDVCLGDRRIFITDFEFKEQPTGGRLCRIGEGLKYCSLFRRLTAEERRVTPLPSPRSLSPSVTL